jgi:hypothetical protein
MRVKVMIVVCLVGLAAVSAFAQTRTVTNADLEKFRQARLQGEMDYRENYRRMGFPSPTELEEHLENSKIERETLAARLAGERLQRERIQADLAAAIITSEQRAAAAAQENPEPVGPQLYYGYPSGGYYNRGYYYRNRNRTRFPSFGNGIPMIDFGYPGGGIFTGPRNRRR